VPESEREPRSGGAAGASVSLPAAARGGPISHAIFRLARIHRVTAGQLLRPIGLHPNQELLMMQLWDAGPQRQADLVTMLDSDSATITRTIQRLERAGFVRRMPSEADRRVTIVEPTVASQALRREVEQVWRRLEELTVGGLDDDERRVALRMLERLESNLGEAAAEPGRPGSAG
jgi:MarR family transcriptional regulator, organic hydroperoxide resistance regulator